MNDKKNFIELNKTIKTLPGCVYCKNIDGIYMGCNDVFSEMVGLNSSDEVIGKRDEDFCWKKQASMLRENDLNVIQSGTKSFEETVELSNGKQLTYIVVKSPVQ